MKFSIRDLLWLTALIAVSTAWWLDHQRQAAESQKYLQWVRIYEKDLISTRSSGFAVPAGRIPGT